METLIQRKECTVDTAYNHTRKENYGHTAREIRDGRMKQPTQLVKDMIGHNRNRMECLNCSRELHIPEAQFCSKNCERVYKAKHKIVE